MSQFWRRRHSQCKMLDGGALCHLDIGDCGTTAQSISATTFICLERSTRIRRRKAIREPSPSRRSWVFQTLRTKAGTFRHIRVLDPFYFFLDFPKTKAKWKDRWNNCLDSTACNLVAQTKNSICHLKENFLCASLLRHLLLCQTSGVDFAALNINTYQEGISGNNTSYREWYQKSY